MSKFKTISERYPTGTTFKFHSGNFTGLTGIVKKVNENVKNSIFGFIIEVELSNGKTGFVEKSEHFTVIKKIKLPIVKTMYYIQSGFIGNAALWWAIDSKGYTTEIDKAGKFSKEEAKEIINRPQDRAWECSHIDTCIEARKIIIDVQYLNIKKCLKGKRK